MGGYGSDRPGRRPVNDSSLALPFDRQFHNALADMQRAGSGIRANVITWSRAGRKIGAISVLTVVRRVRDASMLLSYSCNGESMREVLDIVWTQTPFGWRPWWRCPRCKRRCSRLYNPDGPRWRCRTCYDVTYTSSNESDKRLAYSKVWGILDRDLDAMGRSSGVLIHALRAHRRIEEKINRDMERARRHPGKVGRPRKK
jgi:hypothetical protein